MSTAEVVHGQAYLDQDKGPTILGVMFTMTILSTLFVGARVFTRQHIMGKMHLDDWLTAAALVSGPSGCSSSPF